MGRGIATARAVRYHRAMDGQEPDQADAPGERMCIGDAGLVLLNPFLPLFFSRLELLEPAHEGDVRRIADPSRAVHLLSALADGRFDRPDPALALPKLLCGLSPDHVVADSIVPGAADLDLCESLLRAVIGNWHVLGNTTPDGLRETFLQRAGQLARVEDRWQLRVARAPFDVLIDRIPWSFSFIRHGWMPEPLSVGW